MFADELRQRRRPGLLVSVRSPEEALAALAGGADVIDIKEPDRGPLGAADRDTIAAVVRAVAGRAPVTAAAGELVDWSNDGERGSKPAFPAGVAAVKFGLADCRRKPDWLSLWRQAIAALRPGAETAGPSPVAVVYADWHDAGAPTPWEISTAALHFSCRVILVDTWNKSSGTLFDHWRREELQFFVQRMHAHGFAVVLAGSLSIDAIPIAAGLQPQLVAVRGAACDAGRGGTVARRRVAHLRRALDDTVVSCGANPSSEAAPVLGALPIAEDFP